MSSDCKKLIKKKYLLGHFSCTIMRLLHLRNGGTAGSWFVLLYMQPKTTTYKQ